MSRNVYVFVEGMETSRQYFNRNHLKKIDSICHPTQILNCIRSGLLSKYNNNIVITNYFMSLSALRQIHSLSQSYFPTQCALVLPLSIYSILSFLKVSSSCLPLRPHLPITSILPSLFSSTRCFRSQFLCQMWPIQLAFFLLFIPSYNRLIIVPSRGWKSLNILEQL